MQIQILRRYDGTESTLLNISQLQPIEGLWLVNVLEPVLCDAVNGGFFINICDTEKKDTVNIIMSDGSKEEKKISSKNLVKEDCASSIQLKVATVSLHPGIRRERYSLNPCCSGCTVQ